MPLALERVLKRWGLSEARLVGSSPSGSVYKVSYHGRPAVLKVFTASGKEDEKHAAQALDVFNGQAAVRLFESDEEALLMEWVAGENLLSLKEDEKATEVICEVIDRLHFRQRPSRKMKNSFPSLKERFQSLFKAAHEIANNPMVLEAAETAQELIATQREILVLHGDIHHENILHHHERGWLAIDPKGLYGERTYEAANTLFNPIKHPQRVVDKERLHKTFEILSKHLKLDRKRLMDFAFVHGMLAALWAREDHAAHEGHFLTMVSMIREIRET